MAWRPQPEQAGFFAVGMSTSDPRLSMHIHGDDDAMLLNLHSSSRSACESRCHRPTMMELSLLLQAPNQDTSDFEIAKKRVETDNSPAWEQLNQEQRDEKIRWLEGKVRELEVKSWVTSRTLPRAQQAGAPIAESVGRATAKVVCSEMPCSH
jgi:hypothetical protein